MDESFDGLWRFVNAAVRQPDFAVVQGRARRLRRRRTVITGAVTAVLVLLGLGYAVQAAPHRHGQPARPLPSASAPAGPAELPGFAYQDQVFAGGPHDLYALLGRCYRCADQLFASADDGLTWQRRNLPPAPTGEADQNRDPHVSALGPGLLAWGDSPLDTSWRTAKAVLAYQWVSIDGGVTWRRAEVSTTPAAAVPAGTAPVDCGSVGRLSPCRVYAIDPATGRFAPLAVQPPGLVADDATAGRAAGPIGAGLYISGLDPASRKPVIASSSDGGRTWRTAVLAAARPAPALHGTDTSASVPYPVTGVGGVAYAVVPGTRGFLRYWTTDGGRIWQFVSTNDSDGRSFVAPDGSLVRTLSGESLTYTIARYGGPFRPAAISGRPLRGGSPYVSQPAPGLYVIPEAPASVYLSGDGLNWRKVGIG